MLGRHFLRGRDDDGVGRRQHLEVAIIGRRQAVERVVGEPVVLGRAAGDLPAQLFDVAVGLVLLEAHGEQGLALGDGDGE